MKTTNLYAVPSKPEEVKAQDIPGRLPTTNVHVSLLRNDACSLNIRTVSSRIVQTQSFLQRVLTWRLWEWLCKVRGFSYELHVCEDTTNTQWPCKHGQFLALLLSFMHRDSNIKFTLSWSVWALLFFLQNELPRTCTHYLSSMVTKDGLQHSRSTQEIKSKLKFIWRLEKLFRQINLPDS